MRVLALWRMSLLLSCGSVRSWLPYEYRKKGVQSPKPFSRFRAEPFDLAESDVSSLCQVKTWEALKGVRRAKADAVINEPGFVRNRADFRSRFIIAD
jgi:hypothetical protein